MTKSQLGSVHTPQVLKRKASRSGFEPRSLCLPLGQTGSQVWSLLQSLVWTVSLQEDQFPPSPSAHVYSKQSRCIFIWNSRHTHTHTKKTKKTTTTKRRLQYPVTDGPAPQASTRPFPYRYTDTRNTADCRCKDPKTESIVPVSWFRSLARQEASGCKNWSFSRS